MIIGFIGQRGSGKTLSMSIELYKKYLQGYKIYSNYHLNFPHTIITVDDLMTFAESGMYFGNSIFAIDEIHIWFDSRASGKKRNVIFSYFLNQSSKNDIDVYYTSQFSRQVEVRMRLNTEVVVESVCRTFVWKDDYSPPVILENYRPKPNDYKTKAYITNFITKFSDTGADKLTKRIYSGDKYFKLYDTRQVIKMQEDVFDRNNKPKKQKSIENSEDDIMTDTFEIAKSNDKRNAKVTKPEKINWKEKRATQHKNRLFHEENERKLREEYAQ
jgi:hypothetical protein